MWLVNAIGIKTLVKWTWEIIGPMIKEWAESDGMDDWDDAIYRIMNEFFKKFDNEYDKMNK
jgi:hypothetical protein